MKKILLTNLYKAEPLEIVRNAVPEGFEICFLEEQSEQCLTESIADIDYILAGGRIRITEDTLSRAGRLKMIQRSGVGLDTIDLDAMKKYNIPLYVNQGVNSQSVAEHNMLLILSCLRRLTEINRNTHDGIWKKQQQGLRTHELHGKTVGVVGTGKIGRIFIDICRGFGMNIIAYDKFPAKDSGDKGTGSPVGISQNGTPHGNAQDPGNLRLCKSMEGIKDQLRKRTGKEGIAYALLSCSYGRDHGLCLP